MSYTSSYQNKLWPPKPPPRQDKYAKDHTDRVLMKLRKGRGYGAMPLRPQGFQDTSSGHIRYPVYGSKEYNQLRKAAKRVTFGGKPSYRQRQKTAKAARGWDSIKAAAVQSPRATS